MGAPRLHREVLREGALNGIELLCESGMTIAEAEAELKRIDAS